MHQYLFSQSPKQYPWEKSVYVWLVIVGHNDQSATEIRRLYQQSKLSYDQAYHQLATFFTILSPRKNRLRWARFLAQAYKKRWNEEMAFCLLNSIHSQFRYRFPVVQLAELYLRALILNSWQAWRKTRSGLRIHYSHRTFNRYRTLLETQIKDKIILLVKQNLGYLQEVKRKKYFTTSSYNF